MKLRIGESSIGITRPQKLLLLPGDPDSHSTPGSLRPSSETYKAGLTSTMLTMAAPCKELTGSDGDRLLAAHGQFAVCLVCGSKDDIQAHALDHTPVDRASKWHIVPLCGPHHAKLHARFTGQPRDPLPKCVAHFAACAHKVFDMPVETLIHRLKYWIPGRNFGWLERTVKVNLGIKRKPKGRTKTSNTSVLLECLGRGRKRNAKGSPHTLVRQWPSGEHR